MTINSQKSSFIIELDLLRCYLIHTMNVVTEILASDEDWEIFRSAKGDWGDKNHWKQYRHYSLDELKEMHKQAVTVHGKSTV